MAPLLKYRIRESSRHLGYGNQEDVGEYPAVLRNHSLLLAPCVNAHALVDVLRREAPCVLPASLRRLFSDGCYSGHPLRKALAGWVQRARQGAGAGVAHEPMT